MKLNNLRHFLAVAEKGSVRAVARELGTAQPVLSRSIKELERELGVPLFERRARGVVLTAMGEALRRRAKIANSELARARDEIDQLRGMMHGNVRVALSTVAHISLLPYALQPFCLRYPDVHLDIIDALFPAVAEEMMQGSIDCYIGPSPERMPEGLFKEKLFDTTRVIVCRKGHPLGQAKSLRQLVDAKWVSTPITDPAKHDLAPLFEHHGLPPPKLILQAHSSLTFIVAMVYSDLLTMLPMQWKGFQITKHALQTIDVAEKLSAPPICIIQRVGLPLTPAAEHLCDLMRRAAAHVIAAENPNPQNG